jgi:hypothetical protein
VHGLGGHWDTTWSDENGKFWLRDFLPGQLQKIGVTARVFSYGYDSRSAFSHGTTTIKSEAETLLNGVFAERRKKEEKNRPLVFIAHSLGGIIVKKTMVLAWENSERYGDLLNSVFACVFFGVPHRGSDIADWASLPANVLSSLNAGNPIFLSALKRDSAELGDISDQWVQRAAGLKRIMTFYEKERLHGVLVRRDKDATY